MAVVKVDWDSMESNEFELLEPGTYPARIEKIEQKKGRGGYDYLNFTYFLEEQNQRIWDIYSFSPKALWKMKQDFEKLGLDVTGEFDTDELIGRDVILTIIQQDHYQGGFNADGTPKQENRVEAMEPGGF